MAETDRFGELRSLLQRPPSAAAWDHLCLALEQWPADELRDQALPYVTAIVERWPSALRQAPPRWIKAFIAGKKIAWLPLVRGLSFHGTRLGEEGMVQALDALSAAQLERLDLNNALAIQGDGPVGVIEHRALSTVRELKLDMMWRSGEEFARSLSAPTLGCVESLTLNSLYHHQENFFDDALRWLQTSGQTRWLGALRALHIGWLNLSAAQLKRLHHILPLDQVEVFTIYHGDLNAAQLEALLGDGAWRALRQLKLPELVSDLASIRALAREPLMDKLESLRLNLPGDDAAMRTLLDGGLSQLHTLHISGSGVSDEGLRALARYEPPALRDLHLPIYATGTPDGFEELMASALGARLERLRLQGWNRGGDLARAISVAGPLPSLRELDMSGLELGQRGAMLLSRATLPNLRALRLNQCQIDAPGLKALMEAPWMAGVEELELRYSKLDAASLRGLLGDAHRWGQLCRLELGGCNLGPGGVMALAQRAGFGRIEALGLSHNMMGASALGALLRAPWLSGLRELDLSHNNLDDEAAVQIAACASLWGLERLELQEHALLTKAGELALDASPHLNTLAWPRRHSSSPLRAPPPASRGARALGAQAPTVRKRGG